MNSPPLPSAAAKPPPRGVGGKGGRSIPRARRLALGHGPVARIRGLPEHPGIRERGAAPERIRFAFSPGGVRGRRPACLFPDLELASFRRILLAVLFPLFPFPCHPFPCLTSFSVSS